MTWSCLVGCSAEPSSVSYCVTYVCAKQHFATMHIFKTILYSLRPSPYTVITCPMLYTFLKIFIRFYNIDIHDYC